MQRILLCLLLLVGLCLGQTKYFLPVPIESSSGRPIQNADVDLYQSGSKVEDCIWLNAGRYYYTDTTVVTPGSYDIYVNDILYQENTYINYGENVSGTFYSLLDYDSDSINFPDSLDVHTEFFSGSDTTNLYETYVKKLFDAIRVMQEKMGVLGGDSLLSAGEIGTANVTQYGAVTNNVDSASWNSTKIQAAIDDSYSKIIIGNSRADTFWVRQPIELKSNMTLEINGVLRMIATDTSNLSVDADSGDTYIVVDDATVFEVGDWVCIMDTSSNNAGGQYGDTDTNQDRYIGDGDSIIAISGDTLKFGNALWGGKCDKQGTKGFQVADEARAGVQNSIFIAYDVDNIHITGRGVIDGNKNSGFNSATPFGLRDYYANGEKVDSRATQSVLMGNTAPFLGCNNVRIDGGLTIKSAININVWFRKGDYFWLENCTVDSAYDKNVLIIFSDYAWVNNCVITNGEYEDGIVPYSGNKYVYMTNNYIANNNRGGINIGGSSEHIISANNYLYNNGVPIRSEGGDDFTSTSDRILRGGRIYSRPESDSTYFSGVWLQGSSNFHFVNLKIDSSDGYANISIEEDCEDIQFIGGWSRNAKRGIRLRRVSSKSPDNIVFQNMEISGHSEEGVITTTLLNNIKFDNCVFKNNNGQHYDTDTDNFVDEVDDGNIVIINCDSLYNTRVWKKSEFKGGIAIGNIDYPLDSCVVGIDTTGGVDTESMFVYNDVNVWKMPTAQARSWLLTESFEETGLSTGWDTVFTGGGSAEWDDTGGILHRDENLKLTDSCYVQKAISDTTTDYTWIFFSFMITDTVKERYVFQFLDADTVDAQWYLKIHRNDSVASAHRRFRIRNGTVESGYNTTKILDSTLYYIWMRVKPATGVLDSNSVAELYVSDQGVRPQYPEITHTTGTATRAPAIVRFMGLEGIRTRYDYLLVDDAEIYSIVFF